MRRIGERMGVCNSFIWHILNGYRPKYLETLLKENEQKKKPSGVRLPRP